MAEWDNREIPRSCFLSVFMALFWIIWTPTTIFVTHLLLTGKGPAIFFFVWLIFGYLGVILIPASWFLRYTVERIEIGAQFYRHYYVNAKWLFPKHWPIDDITRIDFGHFDDESIKTLNIRKGSRRDMIAYFRKVLFEAIRAHLIEIGSKIEVIDWASDKQNK